MRTTTFPSDPRSVADARAWAARAFADIGREDLVESARLAISELVTNALLHADPPIRIGRGGTPERPYFKVCDGSVRPPVPSPPLTDEPEEAELLLTVGRGLGIVATCSQAWGAQIHADGKVVWCVPRPDPGGEADPPSMVLEYADDVPAAGPGHDVSQTIGIHLVGLPVSQYREFQAHQRALAREVRLIALTDPHADQTLVWAAEQFSAWARVEIVEGGDALAGLANRPDGIADVNLRVTRESLESLRALRDALECVDAHLDDTENGSSLLVEPTDELGRRFRRWYLGEFLAQSEGDSPTSWAAASGTEVQA